MTSQVYYRKWRPSSFSELAGQEHVSTTLRQSVRLGRIAHSYLFCGPRGCGKTTTARIIAKAANCLDLQDGDPCNACVVCQAINEGRFMDIIELDAASNRGIDEIRDIREKVNFAPAQGRRKVYIIDEAHMLTDAASNAFLKTLEEPPEHVIFVLCTTEAHRILPTIISRCQRLDFRRIPSETVFDRLSEIADAEGVAVEPAALRIIARYASGSLRDAENLLEQLVVSCPDGVTVPQVEKLLGMGSDETALELVKYLLLGNTTASLLAVNQAAWEGSDLRQLHRRASGPAAWGDARAMGFRGCRGPARTRYRSAQGTGGPASTLADRARSEDMGRGQYALRRTLDSPAGTGGCGDLRGIGGAGPSRGSTAACPGSTGACTPDYSRSSPAKRTSAGEAST